MPRWLNHLLHYTVFCFLCCMLLLHIFAIRASAYSDAITVTSQNHAIAFPNSISFQISATDSSSNIINATLSLKFGENGLLQQRSVPVPTPSQDVTLHWQEDTTKNTSFTPTGTNIYYTWKLQDTVGNSYVDTQRSFMVIDNRFSWQHLNEGLLQINWYKRPPAFGQAMLEQVSTSMSRIKAKLGAGLTHPATLWVYQSIGDFHGSLPPDTYEWVGGIAFPDLNTASIVAEDVASDTLVRDMPHELTHIVFHQLISNGIYAPVWFDEGLAVYNQLYHEPGMALRLKKALQAHTLLRFNEIALNFPADADQAYLAYTESWNLIDYMYSTFGTAKMFMLIKNMNNPKVDFNSDLDQTIGMDQIHLENQWRMHLNQSPIADPNQTKLGSTQSQPLQVDMPTDNTLPFIFLLGLLMVVLPIVGLAVVFVGQRKRRVLASALPQTPRPVHNGMIYPVSSPPPPPLGNSHPPPYQNGMWLRDGTQQLSRSMQEYLPQRPQQQAPQE
ncbi:MAG: hypothetical protein E6J34_07845 [Chloroflexi bacterium]|nr:MAG: hypothetical protein E6J34_07845 [Chloroflexota bacterium]